MVTAATLKELAELLPAVLAVVAHVSTDPTPTAGLEEAVTIAESPISVISPKDALQRYGTWFTKEQKTQIGEFVRDRSVDVIDIAGETEFNLLTDQGLAAVAQRKIEESPVEGVAFTLSGDLREPTALGAARSPGLVAWDPVIGNLSWASPSLRTVEITADQMQKLKPADWIALSVQPTLTVERLLSQGILLLTVETDQGTRHLLFV